MFADASKALVKPEEESSCDGMEAFVKSFIPSLFDSDSDTEDAYYPSSSSPAMESSLDLTAPLQSSVGGGPFADGSAEASSPSSQGASCLSVFQSPVLDTSAGSDEQSTFRTMHSVASCSTVFDDLFDDELPSKRAKMLHTATPQAGTQSCTGAPLLSEVGEAAFPAAHSGKLADKGKHGHAGVELLCSLPRPNSLQRIDPHSTSGIAVCAAPAPAAVAHLFSKEPSLSPSTGSSSWTSVASTQSSKGSPSYSVAPGPWPAPHSMIPTAPITMFYQQQHGITAGPPPVQQGSCQPNVAAALAQLADPAMAPPPLGLKLDKASVMSQLREMGMGMASRAW